MHLVPVWARLISCPSALCRQNYSSSVTSKRLEEDRRVDAVGRGRVGCRDDFTCRHKCERAAARCETKGNRNTMLSLNNGH